MRQDLGNHLRRAVVCRHKRADSNVVVGMHGCKKPKGVGGLERFGAGAQFYRGFYPRHYN